MPEKRHLFARVFRAELEDLEEEIETMEKLSRERLKNEAITPYVYLENAAILKREVISLRRFIHDVCSDCADETGSVQELYDLYDKRMKEETQTYQSPEVVYTLAKRRMDKVFRYVTQES